MLSKISARFYWVSPVVLWKEKQRIQKKLEAESDDYRYEQRVLNTLALYWHISLVAGLLIGLAIGQAV